MTRNSRKSGEGSILHLFASLPDDRPVLEGIALWTAATWTPVSTLIRASVREWLDKQAGKRPSRRGKIPAEVTGEGYQPRPAKWVADLVEAMDGASTKKSVVLHVFLSASDPGDVALAKDLEAWREDHFMPPVSALLKAAVLDFTTRHGGKIDDAERQRRLDALRAAVVRTYPAAAYTRRSAARAAGALPGTGRVRRSRKVAAPATPSPATEPTP